MGIAGSPSMGQPMSSSYENQWLASDDKKALGRRKSIVDDTKDIKSKPDVTSPNPSQQSPSIGSSAFPSATTTTTPTGAKDNNSGAPARKSQKNMTKAERRALQEQQRQEKERRVAAGLPKNAKKAAELLEKQPTSSSNSKPSTPKMQHNPPAASGGGDDSVVKKKSTNASSLQKAAQRNQVPWLLHLDAPKRPDTAGSYKDLHPAVKTLALYFSEYKIVGSNARCVAMLETFSKVSHHRWTAA